MAVRVEGRRTLDNASQYAKAYLSMLATPSGKDTEVREVHVAKAEFPILSTPSGMSIDVSAVQPWKASSSMNFFV